MSTLSSILPSAVSSPVDVYDTEAARRILYAHVDTLLAEAFEGYDAGPNGNDPYVSKDTLGAKRFGAVLIVRSQLFTVVNDAVLSRGDVRDMKETVRSAARKLLPRLMATEL